MLSPALAFRYALEMIGIDDAHPAHRREEADFDQLFSGVTSL